ncbi:hypothetical protein [Bacillus sp. OAE603]|uniref:hypothetical protein n=1 Tax=Gottfriedia sp. OAE603 TaxID=2663872 RepID=UPI00178B9DF3
MILRDLQISNTVKEIKKFKQSVNKIYLRYSNKTIEPYFHIKPTGPIDVISDEEYYENLEDNLSFMMYSWLNPIIKQSDHCFEGVLQVDGDGNIETDEIPLELILKVPDNNNLNFFKRNLSKLLLLEQFITKVTFKGHKKRLSAMNIHLRINAKQITKLLKTKECNQALVRDWLANIEELNELTSRFYAIEGSIPVANGKITLQLKEITVTCHHSLNGESDQE